jgi:hypothetical protein
MVRMRSSVRFRVLAQNKLPREGFLYCANTESKQFCFRAESNAGTMSSAVLEAETSEGCPAALMNVVNLRPSGRFRVLAQNQKLPRVFLVFM